MDLDYFTRLRQGPVDRLIRWLQHRSLLANPLHCSGCNRDMELVEREAGHVDGYQWFVSFSFTIIIYFFLIQIPNSTLLDQHWFFDIKGQENFKTYIFLFHINQKSRSRGLDAMIIKDERVQKRGNVGISPNKGVLPPKKWRQAKGRRFFWRERGF